MDGNGKITIEMHNGKLSIEVVGDIVISSHNPLQQTLSFVSHDEPTESQKWFLGHHGTYTDNLTRQEAIVKIGEIKRKQAEAARQEAEQQVSVLNPGFLSAFPTRLKEETLAKLQGEAPRRKRGRPLGSKNRDTSLTP